MPPPLSSSPARPSEPTLRIAHLGTLDAAPLLVARARGFFEQEGVAVDLRRELGVAALTAKLGEEQLDGACVPAHLPVLWSLGVTPPAMPAEVVLITSYQDLAVVLAGRRPAVAPRTKSDSGLRLGLVNPGSAAKLVLHHWLQLDFARARLDPAFVPIASSQLVSFLAEDAIDGFCAPEPWPTLAVAAGGGAIVARSADLFPRHPGGCVALRRACTQAEPAAAAALARALLRARLHCADPAHAPEVWRLVLAEQETFAADDGSPSPNSVGLPDQFERFFHGPTTGCGLDHAGAQFVERACRSAAPDASRRTDFRGEIARTFQRADPADLNRSA